MQEVDWYDFLGTLRERRDNDLAVLEDSFAALRDMRLVANDGLFDDPSRLIEVLDFITRVDGFLQGMLEVWSAYKTTIFSLFDELEVEYELIIDRTRESLSSLRSSRMSWEERDAYCRLRNKELHNKYRTAKNVTELINNTLYELKLRQKYLYAKRQSIDTLTYIVQLQLRLTT